MSSIKSKYYIEKVVPGITSVNIEQKPSYWFSKKKLIYNELIWHFIHSKITLGNTYEKVVFNKISGLQPANANKSEVTYK